MRTAAMPRLLFRNFVAASCCAMALGACSTTGTAFQASALSRIVPGETTFEQASVILGAPPVDTYRQLNGALMARWAHKASLLTDAIYHRQELWLAFGPDGRFDQVVRTINVPATQQPAHSAIERTVSDPIYKPAVAYPIPQ